MQVGKMLGSERSASFSLSLGSTCARFNLVATLLDFAYCPSSIYGIKSALIEVKELNIQQYSNASIESIANLPFFEKIKNGVLHNVKVDIFIFSMEVDASTTERDISHTTSNYYKD